VRCKKFFIFIFIFLLCFQISTARAQTLLGPAVRIGPLTAHCADPNGKVVMNYAAPTPMTAQAAVLYGGPAIFLNFAVLNNYPPQFQVFTYVHECGHHFNGDILLGVNNSTSELNADCYAAKMTRNLGWLNPQDFAVAMSVLKTFKQDPTHPSGAVRKANAENCYNTP